MPLQNQIAITFGNNQWQVECLNPCSVTGDQGRKWILGNNLFDFFRVGLPEWLWCIHLLVSQLCW